MILPEPIATLPGLAIESEYRPAREVGGDFFQILPHASNGSMLIVAGDVAGKGLQAGMLVALLVGAIRTSAQFDPDPLVVLKVLNQRLCGRSHAAATCLALRIGADGGATLANAGHLPPYLNGLPVQIEGSLPLGMIEDPEFSVMRFNLARGRPTLADVRRHCGGHRREWEALRFRTHRRPAARIGKCRAPSRPQRRTSVKRMTSALSPLPGPHHSSPTHVTAWDE